MEGMKIKNYSLNFFGSMNGDFNVSPQEYHRSFRNQTGASRAFVGPWNYAGGSPGSVKRGYISAQEQPKKASIQRGGFVSPQNQPMSTSRSRGFVSPVNDLSIGKTKTYSFGTNRTQAISEE